MSPGTSGRGREMARFVAIPVGQGDAFYLERGETRILVDGGKSRHGFAQMFRDETGSKGADIVVCTHNDADHANGIIGFLEAGLGKREIWLPGKWLGLLDDVLGNPGDIAIRLLEELKALDESQLSTKLEDLREDPLGESPHSEGEPVEIDKSGWPPELVDQLEVAADWEPCDLWVFSRVPYVFLPPLLVAGPIAGQSLFIKALDAARRIREIALEAFRRGLDVRWFKLLFAADSDLATASLPPHDDAIVTAPHHGSEANKMAYQCIASKSCILVRSDGRFKKRPGPSFLGQTRRFCTICRSQNQVHTGRQAVRFFIRRGAWIRRRTKPCICV